MPEVATALHNRWFRIRWPGQSETTYAWAEKFFDSHSEAFDYYERRLAEHPPAACTRHCFPRRRRRLGGLCGSGMSDLPILYRAPELETVKRLVLDAVSSPLTRTMYARGAGGFFPLAGRAGQAGLLAGRRAGPSRRTRKQGLRPVHHQPAPGGHQETGARSRRQRAAGCRDGGRHRPGGGRQTAGGQGRELADQSAGRGAHQFSGSRRRSRASATARCWPYWWAAGCAAPKPPR